METAEQCVEPVQSYSNNEDKTPERRQWRHSGFFLVNFEQISRIVLVFLLLILNKEMPAEFAPYRQVFATVNFDIKLLVNIK